VSLSGAQQEREKVPWEGAHPINLQASARGVSSDVPTEAAGIIVEASVKVADDDEPAC
jgi:hypothetical protein